MDDATHRPRVLIVADRPREVQLLERALRRQGYTELGTAASADEAVDLLPQVVPEALLVDLRLLHLDRYELLHRLHESPRWRAVPVLALVSIASAAMIRTAAAEGTSGFIGQPFNAVEITYKIEQAIRNAARRAAEWADLQDSDVERPDDGPDGDVIR